MTIKITSELNYEDFCREMGVTMDELMLFIQNKDIAFSNINSTYPTIIHVIDQFSSHLTELNKLGKRSDTTLTTYFNFLNRCKKHLQEQNPDLTIDQLNENLLLKILSNSTPRKGEKLSKRTTNKYLAILRKLLDFSYQNDLINKDLRHKFIFQSIDTLPRYLTDDKLETAIKKALQRTYGYRCRAMLIFLAGTGCRVSELVKMKVCDFNINENIIYIKNGKGNKDRIVPMFKVVKRTILHYLKISGLPKWQESNNGYLFCRDEGNIRERPLSDDSVQYLVRNIFREMGLNEDFTVHSFRHTFSVNCLKAGMKLHYLTQILGHEDPKTTKIYTKLLPHDLRDEVMKFFPFPLEKLLNDII